MNEPNPAIRDLVKKLIKGGEKDQGKLYGYLLTLSRDMSPRPEPEELERAIKETLDEWNKSHELGIKLVSEWVKEEAGEFSLAMAYDQLGAKGNKLSENIVRNCLRQLVDKGIIAKASKRRGIYRKIDEDAEPLDWTTATTDPISLYLPLEMDKLVNIYPGNIIVVAGENNIGKTALCIDFVKHNMYNHSIHYFSSEMGPSEFRLRLEKHDDITADEWRFKAYEHAANFSDVIRPGEINVVDYLEVHDNFWLVASDMAHIHSKLKGGIALIAMQKGKFSESGRGGDFSMEKPRLYITLSKSPDYKGGIAKILKAKNWKGAENPNGKTMQYKLIAGAKFVFDGVWTYPESREAVRKFKF